MTRSKGVGRGGSRTGAGRKKNRTANVSIENVSQPAPVIELSDDDIDREAIAALVDVVRNSGSDAARVAAARDLLDRVRGKASPAKPKGDDQKDMQDHWEGLLDIKAPSATGRAN